MFSQDDDGQQGLVLTVVFGLVALVISVVLGMAISAASTFKSPASGMAPAAAPPRPVAAGGTATDTKTADAMAALAASDAAIVKVEAGVVKFYFATGKADLPPGAAEALADVITSAREGRKLVISGFHDATGDAARNIELAKKRAFAVRDALKASGVKESQLELKKPEQTQGGSNAAEARRVEVSVL
jgi:outer membrane protein OmpA-like peptidoglycan-associated protein